MDLNPYLTGAITGILYLLVFAFLPDKIQGRKRVVFSIVSAIAVSLIIQFIIDCIAE